MAEAVVIDTNVLIVANERADQAGPDCVINCINALKKARERQITVIDSEERIFEEYFRHMSRSGEPGLGDKYAKGLFDHQFDETHGERVTINEKHGDQDNFEEFPEDPRLLRFDRSDRKFVAVARASENRPIILNATDSDWWIFRSLLGEYGVEIDFLCPDPNLS
jgi:hypothetical protein